MFEKMRALSRIGNIVRGVLGPVKLPAIAAIVLTAAGNGSGREAQEACEAIFKKATESSRAGR
jgi:hypothetical protein